MTFDLRSQHVHYALEQPDDTQPPAYHRRQGHETCRTWNYPTLVKVHYHVGKVQDRMVRCGACGAGGAGGASCGAGGASCGACGACDARDGLYEVP